VNTRKKIQETLISHLEKTSQEKADKSLKEISEILERDGKINSKGLVYSEEEGIYITRKKYEISKRRKIISELLPKKMSVDQIRDYLSLCDPPVNVSIGVLYDDIKKIRKSLKSSYEERYFEIVTTQVDDLEYLERELLKDYLCSGGTKIVEEIVFEDGRSKLKKKSMPIPRDYRIALALTKLKDQKMKFLDICVEDKTKKRFDISKLTDDELKEIIKENDSNIVESIIQDYDSENDIEEDDIEYQELKKMTDDEIQNAIESYENEDEDGFPEF
jgi:hypothetical protein